MAAGSSDLMTSYPWTTTTMTSPANPRRGAGRRRKSRKNSRRKQRPKPPPPQAPPTVRRTGTGNATSSTAAHATEITTTPNSGRGAAADGRSRVPEKRRRPTDRKSTNRTTGNGSAAASSSSVYRLPIATAVPYYVDVETSRRGYVTSARQPPAWDDTGASLATVVGLATVSVLAFWLVVTVVVLACLLARRSKMAAAAKPRPGVAGGGRWSWSGNQLVGLLDDSLEAPPPPESAPLYSPPRWNSVAAGAGSARRRQGIRRVVTVLQVACHWLTVDS